MAEHLINIFQENELQKEATCTIFAQVQTEGSRHITRDDVSIAQNYLTGSELQLLGRIVNGYWDFAEEYAKQHIPLTMEDWAKHLDLILQANGKDLLQNAGKITAALAKQHAENEFEKYRPHSRPAF
jgi:hypothetical protein